MNMLDRMALAIGLADFQWPESMSREEIAEKYREHALAALKAIRVADEVMINGALSRPMPMEGETVYHSIFAGMVDAVMNAVDTEYLTSDWPFPKGEK